MAVVGATIENPRTGESITWVETAASSGGELLSLDLALRPDAALAAEHRHLEQTEHFRVLEGRVGLAIGDQERELGVGDDATVAHRWWPVGDEGAVMGVELQPALETEVFQIAVAYDELGPSCPRVVNPPLPIQRLILTPLAPSRNFWDAVRPIRRTAPTGSRRLRVTAGRPRSMAGIGHRKMA